MAKKEVRFHVTSAGDDAFLADAQIWIDKKTGVNYLFVQNGSAGGLTVLVDTQGKPIITPPSQLMEE